MDQKTRLNYMVLTETHFKCEDTYRIKIKRWGSIYHMNTNHKKAGVAILTSDREQTSEQGRSSSINRSIM